MKPAKGKQPKAIANPAEVLERERDNARFALSPSMNAAGLAQAFSVSGTLDLVALIVALREQSDLAHTGDTRRMESMLVAQAHSLDVMFANLARRGIAQEGLKQYETHMKLALRAQSQCRATLETLAAIKNPPVVFAKQANIAHGHQQVNNGEPSATARAGENANAPNKLLEAPHDKPEWMDAGKAATAAAGNPPMATVATLNRPAHG